jgi:hypothetical protein
MTEPEPRYKAIRVEHLEAIEDLLRGYQIAVDNVLYKNGIIAARETEAKIDAALENIEKAETIVVPSF